MLTWRLEPREFFRHNIVAIYSEFCRNNYHEMTIVYESRWSSHFLYCTTQILWVVSFSIDVCREDADDFELVDGMILPDGTQSESSEENATTGLDNFEARLASSNRNNLQNH